MHPFLLFCVLVVVTPTWVVIGAGFTALAFILLPYLLVGGLAGLMVFFIMFGLGSSLRNATMLGLVVTMVASVGLVCSLPKLQR